LLFKHLYFVVDIKY